MKMRDVKRMTEVDLKEELVKMTEAFYKRGDHGGSPGEWAWERMSEIDTELKRRKRDSRKA